MTERDISRAQSSHKAPSLLDSFKKCGKIIDKLTITKIEERR